MTDKKRPEDIQKFLESLGYNVQDMDVWGIEHGSPNNRKVSWFGDFWFAAFLCSLKFLWRNPLLVEKKNF